MFDDFGGKTKRRKVSDPPLISMIGVLSMLIMFLVVGTIFGPATIELPSPFELAVGRRNNEIFAAPQVIFIPGGFRLSFGEKIDFPLDVFARKTPESKQLYKRLVSAVEGLKRERKMHKGATSLPLNVIAERTSSYRIIFDVLSGLRDQGFTTMLFVSRFEESRRK